MSIQFPLKLSSFTTNTTVAFPAQLNGIDGTCEISTEALQDHFGATSFKGEDLIKAFETNRTAIEVVARVKLPQRMPAGRCLLVSADF